jgi:hypothetical protein
LKVARYFLVGAIVVPAVFAAIVLVRAQSPDPRVAQLQSLVTQIGTIHDSAPALSAAVKTLLEQASASLTQAAAQIPEVSSPTQPSPGLGACGESMIEWHPPVVNGCNTGHEHGDEPPAWATAFSQAQFGHGIIYGGDETSSAAENGHKHAAFKGVIAQSAAGGTVYVRYHAASNPLDRSAQYHSYEVYYQDTAGGVSFWQGWYNSGDPATARVLRRNPPLDAENQRPIILVTDETSFAQNITYEQWYAHATGKWSWDMGIAIGDSTTYYRPSENATAMDASTWVPTGSLGLTRRVDGFWYLGRDGGGTDHVGKFCATAMGDVVDCMAPGALAQYIAPTLKNDVRNEFGVQRISFLVQKAFPGQGVKLPN